MTGTLSLKNVSVTRNRRRILDNINCSLTAGQIVGVIGPNGAGKSTLLGAIAGIVACDGLIRFAGAPIHHAELGFMPQQSQVAADLTVIEVVLLGRHERLGWRVAPDVLEAAGAILAEFGLVDLAPRKIRTLSGGQQQLVMLAQRLLREPRLLLLDEATSALDLAHQMRVFDLLRRYVTRTGALVLFAIHDLNLAGRHADSIMMLGQGGLVGAGAFEAVMTPTTLRDIYGVEAEFLTCRQGRPVILPLSTIEQHSPSKG
ncbi:ABC transporter ATP-binding protein [Rhizobium sp. RU36D]|uniref:ABC transporter ATP-binding protein n=1 Tax=Rhizobium sp. RU36D TaxID=1907415 RepID=UPI0009D8DD25|nr:ABC transporter ATP-binding protein [Rhizobium sp. RU36D]SMD19309.1 iron complex transport system ATP-binding protein [Rhizobium sp. RU36D]